MEWKENLLTRDEELFSVLRETKRIAVLGIKPESHAGQPAFYVPKYLQGVGYDVIPVPTYYPEVTEILGEKVERDLTSLSGEIDMVNVFRRPSDIDAHVEDILAAKPKSVWFQMGIRNDAAAERFAQAGIKVVQDACIMVVHRMMR